MRTLVSIPPEDLKVLDRLSAERKQPRAKVVREAIREYVAKHSKTDLMQYYGLWKDRGIDALEYERQLRDEWSGR